jgi:hypothetical protein
MALTAENLTGDGLIRAISDKEIDAFASRTAITRHYPVGTCKISANSDSLAVRLSSRKWFAGRPTHQPS